MSARGHFVVLEGADGTGTTTQLGELASHLRATGRTVTTTCEPSSGSIGKEIRARLKAGVSSDEGWRALALLFAADRLDHVEREISPALARGEIVISDRYVLSSLVYQALHVDEDFVRTLNRYAPAPDLTLVFSVPLDDALARIAARKGTVEVYDARDLQARVHDAYARLAPSVDGVVVDGTGSIAEVRARILALFRARGIG
jgi:dTMP kinase